MSASSRKYICILAIVLGILNLTNNVRAQDKKLDISMSYSIPDAAKSSIADQIKQAGIIPKLPVYITIVNNTTKPLKVLYNPAYPTLAFDPSVIDKDATIKPPPFSTSMAIYVQKIKPNESFTTYFDLDAYFDFDATKPHKFNYELNIPYSSIKPHDQLSVDKFSGVLEFSPK